MRPQARRRHRSIHRERHALLRIQRTNDRGARGPRRRWTRRRQLRGSPRLGLLGPFSQRTFAVEPLGGFHSWRVDANLEWHAERPIFALDFLQTMLWFELGRQQRR
jgi:hypothetical protein